MCKLGAFFNILRLGLAVTRALGRSTDPTRARVRIVILGVLRRFIWQTEGWLIIEDLMLFHKICAKSWEFVKVAPRSWVRKLRSSSRERCSLHYTLSEHVVKQPARLVGVCVATYRMLPTRTWWRGPFDYTASGKSIQIRIIQEL